MRSIRIISESEMSLGYGLIEGEYPGGFICVESVGNET